MAKIVKPGPSENPSENSSGGKPGGELPMIAFHNAKIAHGYLVGGTMTLEQVAEAKEKGYVRIIDMRHTSELGLEEERAKAEELGLQYILLPISSAADMSPDLVQKFAELLDEDPGPTIVHCRSGNRVGAMFALRAHMVDKTPADEALQIGLDVGMTSLQSQVSRMLGL